jgi:hypothetical protein
MVQVDQQFTYKESDHLLCQPDLPFGCPRCIVKMPTICCELCTPAHFEDIARVSIEKAKNRPARSTIDKNYTPTPQDEELRAALHDFRKTRTLELHGRARLRDLGPGIIMGDDVLQRIVDCSHFYLIGTTAQLAKETHWSGVDDCDEKVLSLIKLHCPKPASTSGPLAPIINGIQPLPIIAPRRCGKCKELGHIGVYHHSIHTSISILTIFATGSNSRCPAKQPGWALRRGTENLPPANRNPSPFSPMTENPLPAQPTSSARIAVPAASLSLPPANGNPPPFSPALGRFFGDPLEPSQFYNR